MGDCVYVLNESSIDHHAIVGIFATRVEAEREAAYCSAMQKRTERSGLMQKYHVTEHCLGESHACLLVRLDWNNRVKHTDFFATAVSDPPHVIGEVEDYDVEWSNGVCKAVHARTVDDAIAFARLRSAERSSAPSRGAGEPRGPREARKE